MDSPDKKKIVIVDDEVEMLGFLSKILQLSHYDTHTTSKGREAVDLVDKVKPDLIILDMLIPDMRGEEIAAVLSKNPATANIPIIFLTGLVAKVENVASKIRGKYYVLAKPVTVDELLCAVNKALVN